MTFVFAHGHPEMLAAIAPALGQNLTSVAPLKNGVPTLYLLGTADPLNPIEGGTRHLLWGNAQQVPPIQQSIDDWKQALGINDHPTVVRDDESVKAMLYPPGMNHATFEVRFLKGQGHGWPGGQASGLPESLIGPSLGKIDATHEIWTYFARFMK